MAVAFDNSAKGISTVTANTVCSFTVAAGAILLAGVMTDNNRSISACVANGTNMTQIGRALHTSANMVVTLFGLTAAPSGTVSISATVVGGVSEAMMIGAASYTGARDVNPWGTIITFTDSAVATIAVSISTSTNDRVVFLITGNNLLTATNVTTRITDQAHTVYRWGDTAGPSSVISVSASANATSQNIVGFGFNIIGSLTAAMMASRMTLVGVGF